MPAASMQKRRIWPGPARLMSTVRLIALFFLLLSVRNTVLRADDSTTGGDLPPADTGMSESVASSDLSNDPSPDDPGPDAPATDAEDEPLDLGDAGAMGPNTIDNVDTSVVDSGIIDLPAPEGTESAQIDDPDSPSVLDIAPDDTTVDGNGAEVVAATPISEPKEIEGEDPVDPSATAWKLLDPSYSSQTPLPASGKAMYYNPGVMEKVVENRLKFKRIEICEECIGRVAMLRFGDVNRKVWLQFYGSHLEGPFHVTDTAATQHVGMLLARDWVLDVDYQTAQRWGMRMPYVTIWEYPPLELLMANYSIPLNWNASVIPAPAFERLPHSENRVTFGQHPEEYHTVKRNLQLQHRDVDSYVDLLSDLPAELFVK
jgi:hypothetical protein